MKLFVVGSDNPDPEKWCAYTEQHLVLAETAKDAVKMFGYHKSFPVAEIDVTKARVLMTSTPAMED